MLFADMAAEVVCVERSGEFGPMYAKDMSRRGKKSIVINLKNPEGRRALLKLVETTDALCK